MHTRRLKAWRVAIRSWHLLPGLPLSSSGSSATIRARSAALPQHKATVWHSKCKVDSHEQGRIGLSLFLVEPRNERPNDEHGGPHQVVITRTQSAPLPPSPFSLAGKGS